MKNFILILISIISINCYSQINRTEKTINKKNVVKKEISDKDFIVQKIRIEWPNGDKRVIKKNIYRDCEDFYTKTKVDRKKYKCTDLKVYKGNTCEVKKGVMADLKDCTTTICKTCTSCSDFVDAMTDLGYVVLNCRETPNGYEGDVEKIVLERKMHKIDPSKISKMKIKQN